jgi:hypothetical protein
MCPLLVVELRSREGNVKLVSEKGRVLGNGLCCEQVRVGEQGIY